MSVATMSKVNIIFRSKDQDAVMARLQDMSCVQLDEDSEARADLEPLALEDMRTQTEYLRAGLKFSIDYLLPHEKKKGSFLDRVVTGKSAVSHQRLTRTIEQTDYPSIIEKVQQLEASINEVTNELEALLAERELIKPWREVPFLLNHNQGSTGFDYVLVHNPNAGYEALRKQLQSAQVEFEVRLVNEAGKSQYFYIVFSRSDKKAVELVVTETGGEVVEIDNMTETVLGRLTTNASEILKLEWRQQALQRQADRQARNLSTLRKGYDYYTWQKDRLGALAYAQATASSVVLTGFVETDNLSKLEGELARVSAATAVVAAPLRQDEEPPVKMRNRKWARPFEAITGIYGSPQYAEQDPTPWLAPFFVVFFGLALTDTGYGIILSILAALGLKFLAHTIEAKKLMRVLMVGGIATAVLGVLFGGWLGIVLDDLPKSGIRDTLIGVRLIDPISNPIAVLLLTFALGVIQVMVGLFVNFKWQLKQGKRQEAWLGSGVWLVFLSLLILWVLAKVGVLPAAASGLLTTLLLVAVVAVVLAGTRKTKNWLLKLPVGILSLYDLVGYFSDVLSYSRLLALGLGTGIIAMVVNLIAGIAVDMVPIVGWVFFVLILIAGHIFNIAINVLGAYIHSSRLQFVEFFPKFMEGGGKVFSPFRRENTYIRLTS